MPPAKKDKKKHYRGKQFTVDEAGEERDAVRWRNKDGGAAKPSGGADSSSSEEEDEEVDALGKRMDEAARIDSRLEDDGKKNDNIHIMPNRRQFETSNRWI